MGTYQEQLNKIISKIKFTSNTQVDQIAKEDDVKWFYPLIDNLNAKISGKEILHYSMRNQYTVAANFDKEHERFVLSAPTGTGKSGVIYYIGIKWFDKAISEHKTNSIYHLVNPLNVLNDQTVYDFIFVLKYYIKLRKLKAKDFAIYLNRSESDKAAEKLDNRDSENGEISVFRFRDYNIQKRRKFEIVVSCIPSVKNIDKKWNKEDCISTIDEVHVAKYDSIDEDEEISTKVNWTDFWNALNNNSAQIRGITATVTEEMFYREFYDMCKNMHRVTFNEALASGRVVMACPIFTQYFKNFSLKQIMLEQKALNKEKNFGINYHKILFSCSSNEEIAELLLTSDYEGIFYISTADYGKIKGRKIRNNIEIIEKNLSVPEFSASIENLEDDCMVFHIRQLIAGVNVKGLTGCVLQVIETPRDCIKTQQTIGRCLRKKGTKEAGIVTFLLENTENNPDFFSSKLRDIANLMDAMYGDNWHTAEIKKKKNPGKKGGNELTPPKPNQAHQIPVNMDSYYLDVETKIRECKMRYDFAVEHKNEALKNGALNVANEILNEYSNKSAFGTQQERYNETKKKIASECNWEPFIEFGNWKKINF